MDSIMKPYPKQKSSTTKGYIKLKKKTIKSAYFLGNTTGPTKIRINIIKAHNAQLNVI